MCHIDERNQMATQEPNKTQPEQTNPDTPARSDEARRRHGIVIGIILITIAIMTGVGIRGMQALEDRVDTLQTQCTATWDGVTVQQHKLTSAVDGLQELVGTTQKDQLANDKLIDTAKTDIKNARALLKKHYAIRIDDNENPIAMVERMRDLETHIATGDGVKADIKDMRQLIEHDKTAIDESIAKKKLDDAKTALRGVIDKGATLLDDARDKVASSDAWNHLKSAVDDAKATYDNKTATADDMIAKESPITGAMDEVNASVEQKRIADLRGSASADSNAEDTWTLVYYNAYGTDAADNSGALTQWADNYFIAHDWSANGHRIASKPAHVIVNGQTYHYVDYRILPARGSIDAYFGWVKSNNGVGFQTCYGTTQIFVSHYEPGY